MKIKAGSTDKVNGKLVKFKPGDCLSINCGNGNFIAAIISEKFNKYYDLTLLEYYKKSKPVLADFTNGKFWGTRVGYWDALTYATERKMILYKYIDDCQGIELVTNLSIIDNLEKASYSYLDGIPQLVDYYLTHIQRRLEKTQNAEKFPELSFYGEHLVPMKNIIKQ
jgi:hypothetical protein